jgi:hypothetical protein
MWAANDAHGVGACWGMLLRLFARLITKARGQAYGEPWNLD